MVAAAGQVESGDALELQARSLSRGPVCVAICNLYVPPCHTKQLTARGGTAFFWLLVTRTRLIVAGAEAPVAAVVPEELDLDLEQTAGGRLPRRDMSSGDSWLTCTIEVGHCA